MLMPRKVAHRKHHRGRTNGMTKGGADLAFGEYGIQALEPGWLTARQIEAARIAMTRAIKRGGTLRVGVSGGSAKDSIDVHKWSGDVDISRLTQLYEPLFMHDENFVLQNVLAESLEPVAADDWIIHLRKGVVFHDGKSFVFRHGCAADFRDWGFGNAWEFTLPILVRLCDEVVLIVESPEFSVPAAMPE